MSFDIKQGRQDFDVIEQTTIHWQEIGSVLKGCLLKERHSDLLYYTIFLFVCSVCPKVLNISLAFSFYVKRYMYMLCI